MSEDNNKTIEQAKKDIDKATEALKGEIKIIKFEDYEFTVNTGLLDDVDALDMIDDIENKNNMKTIIDFLHYLVGKKAYEDMKAHFVKKDGRFSITKLSKIYVQIFENFDPKD